MWCQHHASYSAGHYAGLRLLPGSGELLTDFILMGPEILNSTPFEQARTIPKACEICESSEIHVMGVVRDEGVCKERYCSLTFIVRSFGASDLGYRSGWQRLGNLPKLSSSRTTVVIARGNGD